MEYDLLVIAFYLSALTYYIGTLLYMIPLPFYGVKKWAPTLMVDGVFSAVLVFAYTILLWIIDFLGGLLGVNWAMFYAWIGLKLGIVMTLITVLRIATSSSVLTGNIRIAAEGLVSPLLSSLTYVAITLITIMIIALVITSYGARLLALGILLHSIPFRLARAGGAMMISVVLVFSVGLPLMPSYVELISQPLTVPNTLVLEYGAAYVKVEVFDKIGNPIAYPVFSAYTIDQKLLARYQGGANGIVDTADPAKALPASRTYIGRIDIAGIYLEKTIDPSREYRLVNSSYYMFTITLNKTLSIAPLRLVYISSAELLDYSRNTNTLVLHLSTNNDIVVHVITLAGDEVDILLDNTSLFLQPVQYTWCNIDLVSYPINLSFGEHVLEITIALTAEDIEPLVDEVNYLTDTLNITLLQPFTLINPVSYIIFNLLIAPLSYIAILISSSYALARLLGGTMPSLIRALAGGRGL